MTRSDAFMTPYLTLKQVELMRVITAQPEIDLDLILEQIRYETTKQSLQFSIRALIKRGLVEKKGISKVRGRMRQVLFATPAGLAYKTIPAAGEAGRAAVVELGAPEDLDSVPEEIITL